MGNKKSQKINKVIDSVLHALERAQGKFPTWPTDPIHALNVLSEEYGELSKDVLQCVYEPEKTTQENLKTEAIQLAAMTLRFILSLDKYKFKKGKQHKQIK